MKSTYLTGKGRPADLSIFTSTLLVFLLCFSGISYGQSQHEAINVVRKNILAKFNREVDKAALSVKAGKWKNMLSEDGKWPDLNYDTKTAGEGEHLTRIREMAAACMVEGEKGSPDWQRKIENAVKFWLSLDPEPKSDNWWFATIKNPLDAGYILLYMQKAPKQLSDESVAGLLMWMKKSRSIESQASTELTRILGIGMHYIVRGCVTYDGALIKQAVYYTNQALEPDSGRTGIMADYSFHAHGKQLYSHGYGVPLLERFADMAEILAGTSFNFPEKNVGELYKFAHKTLFKLARGGYLDYVVAGRGIARPNNIQASRLIPLLSTYKKLDAPEQVENYEAAIARFSKQQPADYKVKPEHIHSWRSDYSAHIRPQYFVGLRMISTRMVKPEKGNGESLLEYFRGNGSMSVMVRGNEYDNIFPVWKWNQVPGTTVPALKDVSGQSDWFFNYGKTDFVGGASDGEYGVATYLMDDHNTTAKKSWFFFDNKVVCLGAGISSSSEAPVFTTINQGLSNGGVTVLNAKGVKEFKSDSTFSNVKATAIMNDEIGYSFPGGETVQITNGIQTGSWFKINSTRSNEKIEKRVFTLHINHGVRPQAANYKYIIWPAIKSVKEIDNKQVFILSNTEMIQAVYDKATDICEAVFYEGGTLSFNSIRIEASEPCVLIIRNINSASPVLTVADPTQKLKSVTISLTRKKEKTKAWVCNLPKGAMAGKSVSVK